VRLPPARPPARPDAARYGLRPLVVDQAAGDGNGLHAAGAGPEGAARRSCDAFLPQLRRAREDVRHVPPPPRTLLRSRRLAAVLPGDREIGRASCRERVEKWDT